MLLYYFSELKSIPILRIFMVRVYFFVLYRENALFARKKPGISGISAAGTIWERNLPLGSCNLPVRSKKDGNSRPFWCSNFSLASSLLGTCRPTGATAPVGRVPSPGGKVAERSEVGRGTARTKSAEKVWFVDKNITFPPAFLFSHRLVAVTASPRGKLERLRRRF